MKQSKNFELPELDFELQNRIPDQDHIKNDDPRKKLRALAIQLSHSRSYIKVHILGGLWIETSSSLSAISDQHYNAVLNRDTHEEHKDTFGIIFELRKPLGSTVSVRIPFDLVQTIWTASSYTIGLSLDNTEFVLSSPQDDSNPGNISLRSSDQVRALATH